MTKTKPSSPAKKKWERPVLVRLGQINDVSARGNGNDQTPQAGFVS